METDALTIISSNAKKENINKRERSQGEFSGLKVCGCFGLLGF